jgi:hypothetical protein
VALRLTTQRLSLLLHYALQPDRVWDVPRAAVRDVRLQRGAVRISWADDADGNAGISLTPAGPDARLSTPPSATSTPSRMC